MLLFRKLKPSINVRIFRSHSFHKTTLLRHASNIMFSSKSKTMPERESWVDFNAKFGRQGSKTKILETLSIVAGHESFSRRIPQRSISVGGAPTSTRNVGLKRSDSSVGQKLTKGGSLNRRGLFGRTKSQGNIKIGKISHHYSVSPKAA